MRSRALRWLRIAVAALVAGVFAYNSVALHLAARATRSENLALAAPVVTHSAEAASSLAMLNLALGRLDDAEDLAKLALQISPINPTAISVVAATRHVKGDRAAAAQLLDLAASAGWREPLAQYWILSTALEAGQPVVAAERADALLRQGLIEDQIFAHLRQLVASRQGRRAVAYRLAEDPDWRSRFLRQLSELGPAQLREHSALLLTMRSIGVELEREEVAPLVRRLMVHKEFRQARDIWTALVEDGRASLLYDGSFEALSQRTNRQGAAAFEWRMTDPLAIRATLDAPPRPLAGKAVRVSAEGTAAGVFLEQSLVLPPGHYALELAALEADGAELKAIRPRLDCLVGPSLSPQLIGATGAGWSRLRYRFEVPAGCPAQRLGLGLAGESAGRIELWLDELSIEPL